MKGIPGVEQYMPKVKAAIERHLPWPSDAATDIYNRAYEAVANAQQSLTAAGWQPIETSPKDGTEFQCWIVRDGDKDGFWEPRCRYNENGAFEIYQRIDYDQEDFDVCHFTLVSTHWMRQPEAPK